MHVFVLVQFGHITVLIVIGHSHGQTPFKQLAPHKETHTHTLNLHAKSQLPVGNPWSSKGEEIFVD